eukprot:COSAG04_NODE_9094_length_899_cov_1.125000_3_plen_43_part_01
MNLCPVVCMQRLPLPPAPTTSRMLSCIRNWVRLRKKPKRKRTS